MGRDMQYRLIAFWILLTFLIAILEVALSGRSLSRTPLWLVANSACLLVLYEAFLLIYVTIVSRLSFKRLEVLQIPYTLKWGGANFEWTSERTRHSYKLRDLKRWAERPDKFIIYTNDKMLWIIGKKFFEKPEDIDMLRNELSQKK
jgi:hypothetical protein